MTYTCFFLCTYSCIFPLLKIFPSEEINELIFRYHKDFCCVIITGRTVVIVLTSSCTVIFHDKQSHRIYNHIPLDIIMIPILFFRDIISVNMIEDNHTVMKPLPAAFFSEVRTQLRVKNITNVICICRHLFRRKAGHFHSEPTFLSKADIDRCSITNHLVKSKRGIRSARFKDQSFQNTPGAFKQRIRGFYMTLDLIKRFCFGFLANDFRKIIKFSGRFGQLFNLCLCP